MNESKIDKNLFQSEIKNVSTVNIESIYNRYYNTLLFFIKKADMKDLGKKLNKQTFDDFNNDLSNSVKNVVLRSDAMVS